MTDFFSRITSSPLLLPLSILVIAFTYIILHHWLTEWIANLKPRKPTPRETLSPDVQRDVDLAWRHQHDGGDAGRRLITAAEDAGLDPNDYGTWTGLAEATRKANARKR